MSRETLISNVSDTAYWVAYYRAQESDRRDAMFHDPLARKLVGEHGKNIAESMPAISRYTEWSVVSRTVIIDRFIEKCLSAGVDAVLNLGAGLDARPYRMDLPATLEWVEVDQTSVIDHKAQVLRLDKPKCRLTRASVDLADAEKRRAFLKSVLPNAKKILVLTEGVIPYLTPEQVTDLSHELKAREEFCYWITEYFHPKVYTHLRKSVRQTMMRNAPFRFYPEDWIGFFHRLGWRDETLRYTSEIATEFGRRFPMPWWARLIFPFIPQRTKEEAQQMTGYILWRR